MVPELERTRLIGGASALEKVRFVSLEKERAQTSCAQCSGQCRQKQRPSYSCSGASCSGAASTLSSGAASLPSSTTCRFTAFGPLPRRSGSVSKEMRWPLSSVVRPERSTAEMCTNTSASPSSGVINPKPLSVLKNFTVPLWRGPRSTGGPSLRGGRPCRKPSPSPPSRLP